MDSDSPDIPRKKCNGPCQQFLPATAEFFHWNGNCWRSQCRECRKKTRNKAQENQYSLRYAREHRQEKLEYDRQYCAEHREKRRAYGKQWYHDHREEVIAKRKLQYHENPEQERQRRKQYLQTEHGKMVYRVKGHNRRARMKNNGGSHTPQDIKDQYKRQKGKCYWCQKKLEKYHIDHVVPLIRGGTNDMSNIVLACPSCNQHKQARLPHEWPEGGRLL